MLGHAASLISFENTKVIHSLAMDLIFRVDTHLGSIQLRVSMRLHHSECCFSFCSC